MTPPVAVGDRILYDDFNGPAGAAPNPAIWERKSYGHWDPAMCVLDGKGRLAVQAKLIDGVWHKGFLSGLHGYHGPHYFQVRARLAKGAGTLSAPGWSWPDPDGRAPGLEIDFCEALGREADTDYHATVHWWVAEGQDRKAGGMVKNPGGSSLTRYFHTWGGAVYDDRVDFYFAGLKRSTVHAADVGLDNFTTHSMLANSWLDIGGGWPGDPDPAMTSAVMLVDHIHIWKLAP